MMFYYIQSLDPDIYSHGLPRVLTYNLILVRIITAEPVQADFVVELSLTKLDRSFFTHQDQTGTILSHL